nr:protein PLASTID REDOX INSENSITIVE 2, chloroplastic [Ipomoea batatas]
MLASSETDKRVAVTEQKSETLQAGLQGGGETDKFRNHLLERLPRKKDIYGDSIEEIVCICSEILNNFLHMEYGGPGTLLVTPFIDMADTIADRELPGAPQAARTAVKWAQKHVDNDWKAWNSSKNC